MRQALLIIAINIDNIDVPLYVAVMNDTTIHNGLEGIIAAETSLSMVDGTRGRAGHRRLPGRRAGHERDVRGDGVSALVRRAAGCRGAGGVSRRPRRAARVAAGRATSCCAPRRTERIDSMDALRMAAGTISLARIAKTDDDAARNLLAAFPDHRRRLLAAARTAAIRSRRAPTSATPRTFSTCCPARSRRTSACAGWRRISTPSSITASTPRRSPRASSPRPDSDLVSAITGAIGALKGPLHGGAPGPALDMVFEIGDAVARRGGAAEEDRIGREADGLRPSRLQSARSARRRPGRRRGADVHARRRHGALRAGALGRADRAPAARGVQAGPQPADERRVLHRAAAARPRPRSAALHADVRHQPRGRLDRALLRAAAGEPHHPAAVGLPRPRGRTWRLAAETQTRSSPRCTLVSS